MNISIFLQSLSKLKQENLRITRHFGIRHEERKGDVMPDIEGMYELLRSGDPVAISYEEKGKFEVLFNLSDDFDLALVVAVDDTNPEIILHLITCYIQKRSRRVK
mgnify:CR=1 FL=1